MAFRLTMPKPCPGGRPSLVLRLSRGCLRLYRDEDGAVLAVTVLSFLLLFVMSFAVYAVGETVRQRIELQNAADAAAYSAAVVQADTLSRVAVINRAMAWTYVQLGRMNMDYIVDKWLEEVLLLWEIDRDLAYSISAPSNCNEGDWYAGLSRHVHKESVFINNRIWVTAEDIEMARERAAAAEKSWEALQDPIQELRKIIMQMNEAEEDLFALLPERIEEQVEAVLRKNIRDTRNDLLAGGADISWQLIQSFHPLSAYTEVMPDGEEAHFLNFTDVYRHPFEAFDLGTDDWWILDSPGGEGFQRRYKQTGRLVANWDWYGALWQMVEGVCVLITSQSGDNELEAESVIGGDYFAETEHAKPLWLLPEFFGEEGAIVVGVARRMNNPLFFLYRAKGQEGIFKGLTLNEYERFMWTASAARAAFNPHWPGYSNGEYDPTFWDGGLIEQNLMNTDWDAVMLPLHRAWADAMAGSFHGETAGEILEEVRFGSWQPLYGGGGAVGVQVAPDGMRGGEPEWRALEGWTLH